MAKRKKPTPEQLREVKSELRAVRRELRELIEQLQAKLRR
jgi:hypothetical protein